MLSYNAVVIYFSLLMTKARLQKILLGPEEALATYQTMLKLWKDLHEMDIADEYAWLPYLPKDLSVCMLANLSASLPVVY